MKTFKCLARITNTKYTVTLPDFFVEASNWHTAAARATDRAVREYKRPRGLRDRPVEIEIRLR